MNNTCYWCFRVDGICGTLTIEHVIPRSRGGSNRRENRVAACRACNELKGDMLPTEWAIVMRDIPQWWRLAAMRGPRGAQLSQAMREAGFDFNLASNGLPYEEWWNGRV
jgi:hypothetical protein